MFMVYFPDRSLAALACLKCYCLCIIGKYEKMCVLLQVNVRLLAALALNAATCASYRKIMCIEHPRTKECMCCGLLEVGPMILMNLFLSWAWLQGCITDHPEYGALLPHIMGVFFGRETPAKSPRVNFVITTQEASKLRARVGPTH
jgi:hypothetical protein